MVCGKQFQNRSDPSKIEKRAQDEHTYTGGKLQVNRHRNEEGAKNG